jgi:magnesium transporter
MPRSVKRRSQKAGLSPGTLVHIGEKKAETIRITLIDYDESHLDEREVQAVEECFPFREAPTVTWINVDGLHRVDVIEALGNHFGLHPLVLEDIVSTGQRPKIEDFGDHIFFVMRMLRYNEKKGETEDEQFSLILGRTFVLSFQETEGDAFDPIRARIRSGKGRLRASGADYLAYALIDAIVDQYFVILEQLGDRIESLGEQLVRSPTPAALKEIQRLKHEMIFLRRSIWPLREVINGLQRGESSLFSESTRLYLRDVYDHTIQVMDTIETFRDMISSMLEIYLSSLSHRMNEIMKVLTIIATIFIPLTFLAGVYGMNFEYMPELQWRWGYFAILALMLLVAASMLVYFHRRKWL